MANSSSLINSSSTFFRRAARTLISAGAAGAIALTLAACGGGASTTTDATDAAASETTELVQADAIEDATETEDVDITAFSIDPSTLFSKRDLDASYDAASATKVTLSDSGSSAEGEGVTIDGSTVTITAEGTYIISGSLSDGRLVVDTEDTAKVQLVLDGAHITSSTGTALYVKNADKVFMTLAEGSENSLVATGAATEEDEHSLDGALFAADDLTINGEGSLTVQSDQGHGIVGKDEVTLVSGTLEVTAAGSAIQGKDSVAVKDGTYTLTATTDGIHAEHESNGAKGFVYIAGGTFSIAAGSDGVDASNDVMIDGGTLQIAALDDGLHSEYDLTINDGTVYVSESYEALEGATVTVNGGDVNVTASDDGINATGVPDGTTSDDEPAGMEEFGGEPGDMAPGEMGEMPEMPQMPDGGFGEPGDFGDGMGGGPREDMMGSGDGFGNQAMGGPGGGDFENNDTASVTINGGKLVISSGGDGIDSNGSITVTGGETYVNGPTSNGDAPMDYAGEASISGGTIIVIGSAGMAQGFGSSSTQGSVFVQAQGSVGDLIELKDATGQVLASFTAGTDYACILASAPGVEQGATYTLSYGSESVEVTA